MAAKVVVLHGGPSFERARGLLNGMVNFPDLDSFGQVMVELMINGVGLSPQQQEQHLERYLQRFELPGETEDDRGFDRRVMLEALHFAARQFRVAWDTQVPPDLRIEDYQFSRWLNMDLMLQRR
ncbi:hypothetical protein [Xanthomonas phage RTH11]|nr:hypothetical protein [Xanthomonas phage RTH11]